MKRAENRAMRKMPEIKKCREALALALLWYLPINRLSAGSGIGCNSFLVGELAVPGGPKARRTR
jgi:hypothetical protein